MGEELWIRRPLSADEAVEYILDPRNERDFHVMAANYDSNGESGEWDGLTSEDLVVVGDGAIIDRDALSELGPFELWFAGADPAPARTFRPAEALEAVASRLDLLGDRSSPRTRRAIDALGQLVRSGHAHTSVDDLEWGEPGDCVERLVNDPSDLGLAELVDEWSRHQVEWSKVVEYTVAHDLGRHYGVPHCIYCLRAM